MRFFKLAQGVNTATRLSAFAARLERDSRGVSIIEFTLVAPVLGLMVVGIADFGRGFSERYALESAAHRALERAGVGSNKTNYSYVREEAAKAAGVPLTAVTLDNWLECDATRMPTYDSACSNGQQGARYLYVKIEKRFEPMFHWTGGRNIFISGDAAVRVQ